MRAQMPSEDIRKAQTRRPSSSTDLIEIYKVKRWPRGREPGGRGRPQGSRFTTEAGAKDESPWAWCSYGSSRDLKASFDRLVSAGKRRTGQSAYGATSTAHPSPWLQWHVAYIWYPQIRLGPCHFGAILLPGIRRCLIAAQPARTERPWAGLQPSRAQSRLCRTQQGQEVCPRACFPQSDCPLMT